MLCQADSGTRKTESPALIQLSVGKTNAKIRPTWCATQVTKPFLRPPPHPGLTHSIPYHALLSFKTL